MGTPRPWGSGFVTALEAPWADPRDPRTWPVHAAYQIQQAAEHRQQRPPWEAPGTQAAPGPTGLEVVGDRAQAPGFLTPTSGHCCQAAWGSRGTRGFTEPAGSGARPWTTCLKWHQDWPYPQAPCPSCQAPSSRLPWKSPLSGVLALEL